MNFKTNNYEAKANLSMIKIITEQYLRNELSDNEFRELCLIQIDEIIERDLESTGTLTWYSYVLTKLNHSFSKIIKPIKRIGDTK